MKPKQRDASQRRTSERQTSAFISYSRRDAKEFATTLRDRLEAEGFDAFLDVEDIVKGENWRDRLSHLIERADAIVFLVSPASVKSEVCEWEIDHAESLAKRILPVICKPTPDKAIPKRLQRLNYTFLEAEDKWPNEYPKLVQSIREDAALVREHTRLTEQASRWVRKKRTNDELLRGKEIEETEAWLNRFTATDTPPSKLILEYLAASRRRATQRLRRGIAVSVAVSVGLLALTIFALHQRNTALKRLAETHWKNGVVYRDELNLSTIAAHWFAKAAASPDEALADSARLAAVQAVRGANLQCVPETCPEPAETSDPAPGEESAYGKKLSWSLNTVWLGSGDWREQASSDWFCPDGSPPVVDTVEHDKPVRSALLDSKSERIISWGTDNTVRVTELCRTDKQKVLRHRDWVLGAKLIKDDKLVLSWGKDHTVRVWDPDEPLASFVRRHDDEVWGATWAPVDRIISWARDRTIRIWDLPGERPALTELYHQQGYESFRVRVGDDGQRIDSLHEGRLLRRWGIDNGSATDLDRDVVSVLLPHAGSEVQGARFYDDGRKVVTWDSNKYIRLWDTDKGIDLLHEEKKHKKPIEGVQFFDQERWLLSWSKKKAFLWRVEDGSSLALKSRESCDVSLANLVVDSTGTRVLGSSEEGHVWIAPLVHERTSPDVQVAESQDATISVCRVDKGDRVHDGAVNGAQFDWTGTRVLSWDENGAISIRQANGSELTARGETITPSPGAVQATFSPDASQVVISQFDGANSTIASCALQDGYSFRLPCEPLLTVAGKALSLQFSRDGNQVGGVTSKGNVFVIDRAGEPGSRTMTHPLDESSIANFPPGTQFDPQGYRLLSWSNLGELRLWDIFSGDPVIASLYHGEKLIRAVFDVQGQRVLSWGGENQGARIWNLRYDREQASGALERMIAKKTGTQMTSEGKFAVLTSSEWELVSAGAPSSP